MKIITYNRTNSISHKVIKLLLISVCNAILLVGVVGICNLLAMKKQSEEHCEKLGFTAATDAEKALEDLAGENLLHMAVEKSQYINEKFAEVEACVHGIAKQAETIYQNQDSYPERQVALPVWGSKELAAQLLHSKRLSCPTHLEMKEQLKLGNIQDLLVQYNQNNSMISSTYLATAKGWMIQADYISFSKYNSKTKKLLPYEASKREWYQKALKAEPDELIYTDVIQDIHEKEDCIVCAKPVYYQGKVVAVAGVGSYLQTIQDAVLSTRIGKNGYAILVNQDGQILMSPKKKGELAADSKHQKKLCQIKNEGLKEAALEMVSGKQGRKYVTIDGKKVYLAYAPLKSLNWSFVTVIGVDEIIAPAKKSQHRILALTEIITERQNETVRNMLITLLSLLLIATCLAAGIGIVFSYRLTSPIAKLAKEVAGISVEDLNHRIYIDTGDEVEELGNAFNRMIDQIRTDFENIEKVTADKERIRMEIQVASRLQADMLPDAKGAFDERDEFALATFMLPAKGVGGDFYDFFLLDEDHLALIMSDVSGKGVPAALFMVVARTILRSYVAEDITLSQAIVKANEYLCKNNSNGMFVTSWIGVMTISTGDVTYVNAGHCYPVIKRLNGECFYEKHANGLVIAGLEDTEYSQSQLHLEPGDMILLYTDGVTEATSEEEKLYGEDRLLELVRRAEQHEPDKLIQNIWHDVITFQGYAEQFDDITMLAAGYNGPGYQEKAGEVKLDNLIFYLRFLESIIKKYRISDKTFAKLNVALDEIYSNICKYSNAGEVKVRCRVINKSYTGREVQLQFRDNGVPYNPLEKPDPDLEKLVEQQEAGGWGIYLVKTQMDHMEYEYVDGWNVLTLTKVEEK